MFAQNNQLIEWAGENELARFTLTNLPSLRGVHNQQNACAAYATCKALGLSKEQIQSGMKTFPGLPHRMELVGKIGNVTFVNDSKATNVDAAAMALGAFENIYWIAGGQGKEGGLEDLKAFFPHLKKACLIGESAPLFADLLGDIPHENLQYDGAGCGSGGEGGIKRTPKRRRLCSPRPAPVLISSKVLSIGATDFANWCKN